MQFIVDHLHTPSTEPGIRLLDRGLFGSAKTMRAKVRGSGLMAVCLLLAAATDTVAQMPSVIVADRIVTPDGQLVSDQAVAIRHGKIVAVIEAKNVADRPGVVSYPGAVLCPGLIDVVSSIGAVGQAVERTYAVDPGASAVDAVDTRHKDFQKALQAGITAVMITPGRNNLISGTAAVVSTAVESDGPTWLRTDGPLTFSLGSAVFSSGRAPTSRLGAIAMLRDVLVQASAGKGHERVARFVRGELDGLIFCDKAMDVSAAMRTLGSFGSRLGFVHTSYASEIGDELSSSPRHTLIVGPYDFTTSTAIIDAGVAVSKTQVPVVFAGRLPFAPVESLRISAALAVRHGMESSAARRAITSSAAVVAGVGDVVGSIEPGLRADLVVFSDDPLRLNARVLAVYVAGKLVYKDPNSGQN